MNAFNQRLKSDDFFSCYFARTSALSDKFCDNNGHFECEGAFDRSRCAYKDHFINPYANKESRILFKTWELDHK